MRLSQAFAALRVDVIAGLNMQIEKNLLPSFNAEVEDIRKEWEEKRKESEALADHRKRSRIADLVVRRDAFIAELNETMRLTLAARAKEKEYGGEITEVDIAAKDDKPARRVMEVKFKDGSVARMPRSLWIDYKAFTRV